MTGQPAYADAEVHAVHDFAWRNRDGIKGSGSQNGARGLLDRIAPAIAARALREAADGAAPALANEVGGHTSTYSVRKWLHDRADEIEAGR